MTKPKNVWKIAFLESCSLRGEDDEKEVNNFN